MEIPIPFYLDLFSKKNDLGIDKKSKKTIFLHQINALLNKNDCIPIKYNFFGKKVM
jgi:hypothetical protein